ncbi:hypothetical protein [Clostridium botulinum]|uniref:hypothetical protein n=1 Tax=Clostridium botulinum TaxID=1491 RepID=UPI0007730223|nr:hypothetical protein [Clostridium botulinum]NFE96623.1 hypothetical protein [Clostridium botulinum]NFL40101.1 hypothetical protein [Clostridium botulinum]NFL67191.1 hypothetical protein [Clostridium botulinum]NFN09976.1 hypothetical protein [Clostridium botulinum]NFN26763.1 hypothetical protein [Clostridium botulinum]
MEDRLLMLFKFGEKGNLKKLQSGQLYCRNAQYYVDYEKTGNQSVGDKYECQEVMYNSRITLIDRKNGQIIVDGISSEITMQDNQLMKAPMYCCTYISTNDLYKVKEDETSITFGCDCVKLFKDFFDKDYWEYCLFAPADKVLQKFKKTCRNKSIEFSYNKVNYYDPEITPMEKEYSIAEDFNNIAFWKTKNYEDQREFRFLLKNKSILSNRDNFTLNIGNLSEFSTLIETNKLKELELRIVYKKIYK